MSWMEKEEWHFSIHAFGSLCTEEGSEEGIGERGEKMLGRKTLWEVGEVSMRYKEEEEEGEEKGKGKGREGKGRGDGNTGRRRHTKREGGLKRNVNGEREGEYGGEGEKRRGQREKEEMWEGKGKEGKEERKENGQRQKKKTQKGKLTSIHIYTLNS